MADPEAYTSLPIQTRVDIRKIAAIAKYLALSGQAPRSRSFIVSIIVDLFHELLLQDGRIEEIQTLDQALNVLKALGLDYKPGSREAKKILKGLRLESALLSNIETPDETSNNTEADELAERLRKRLEG